MRRFFCATVVLCLPLGACNSAKLSAVDGLAFGALVGVVPPPAENVQVIAKVTNTTGVLIQVTYDACAVVAVFHSSGFNGPVVFDPRPLQNCSATFANSLNAGDAVQINASVVPNLPAGTYFITALITVNGSTRTVNAGTVTF